MMTLRLEKTQLAYLLNQVLTEPEHFGDSDAMESFLTDIGNLIVEHFGGKVHDVVIDNDGLNDFVVFDLEDESIPKNGGIYSKLFGAKKSPLVHCYDSGAGDIDRYTIVKLDQVIRHTESGVLYEALAASCNPFHPQGFGQHIEAIDGEHLGAKIEFSDLPKDVQTFVLKDFE